MKMKIAKLQPLRIDDTLIRFVLHRQDLEDLVQESRMLKRNLKSKKVSKRDFYVNDLYALERLQHNQRFLLYSVGECNLEKNVAIFLGKRFNGFALKGENVDLCIFDLDHLTSARFAYAASELIKRNWKIYSMQLERNNLSASTNEEIGLYLNKVLGYYIQNPKN